MVTAPTLRTASVAAGPGCALEPHPGRAGPDGRQRLAVLVVVPPSVISAAEVVSRHRPAATIR